MSGAVANSEAVILSRAIAPETGDLARDAAQSFLKIKLSKGDVLRINELAAKGEEGSISADEERELENYRNVGRLLELMKSKARISLKRLEEAA